MSSLTRTWRIWAKTIGSRIGDDHESDIAALLRSIWVFVHLVACVFIIIHNGVKLGWF